MGGSTLDTQRAGAATLSAQQGTFRAAKTAIQKIKTIRLKRDYNIVHLERTQLKHLKARQHKEDVKTRHQYCKLSKAQKVANKPETYRRPQETATACRCRPQAPSEARTRCKKHKTKAHFSQRVPECLLSMILKM